MVSVAAREERIAKRQSGPNEREKKMVLTYCTGDASSLEQEIVKTNAKKNKKKDANCPGAFCW